MKKEIIFTLILMFVSAYFLSVHAQESYKDCPDYNWLIQYQDGSTECIPIYPYELLIPSNNDTTDVILDSPFMQKFLAKEQEMGMEHQVFIDEDYRTIFIHVNDPSLGLNEYGEEDPYYNAFDTSEYTYEGIVRDNGMLALYITPRINRLLSAKHARIGKIIKLCGITYVWDEETCQMFTKINYKRLTKMVDESAKWFHLDNSDWAESNEN